MNIVAHISKQKDSELFAILEYNKTIVTDLSVTYLLQKNDQSFDENNVKKILTPSFTNNISKRIWFKLFLPKILAKNNTPVFLQQSQINLLKKYSNHFLFFTHTNFNNKTTVGTLKNAKHIFTTEDFIKEILVTQHNISEQKITTTYYAAQTLPIQNLFANAEHIKTTFTNNAEFFLYEINSSSYPYIIDVLKAFSQFKKRQKSTFKLMIYINDFRTNHLIPNFENYKYKSDVVFIHSKTIIADYLIAASFALIYFTDYRLQHFALVAFKNNIPVIALQTPINKSLFNDVALYATVQTLALQMQDLYKNENLYNNIALQAATFVKKYSLQQAAQSLVSVLLKS